MIKNTTKAVSIAAIITAVLFSVSLGMTEDASACKDICHNADPNKLRIMADLLVPGFGTASHNFATTFEEAGVGESATSTVSFTAKKEGLVYPSFLVKSNMKGLFDSKTFNYKVQYKLLDDKGLQVKSQTKTFTEKFGWYVISGETANFDPLRNGLAKNWTISMTLTVNSIS